MNWKHWPYWLRGGVIGGGVTFIFIGLFYTCIWTTTPGGFICLPFLFISPIFPIAFYFDDLNSFFDGHIPFVVLPILSLLLWFAIGSLIGALIGFIKSKKKTTQ